MKQLVAVVGPFVLALLLLGFAISAFGQTPTGPSQATITKGFRLDWTDNSNNEEGFNVYIKQPDPNFGFAYVKIGSVAKDVTTFMTPAVTNTEGSNYCYAVTAWNWKDEAKTVAQESPRSNDGCGPLIVVSSQLPLTLFGTTLPEYRALEIAVSKPANAIGSKLKITVRDADFLDEGELYINTLATPVVLFPGAPNVAEGTDQVVTIVEVDVPLTAWADGTNRLLFTHTKTNGYEIQAAVVEFTQPVAVPAAPTGIVVE
jgi:hypothetical protein